MASNGDSSTSVENKQDVLPPRRDRDPVDPRNQPEGPKNGVYEIARSIFGGILMAATTLFCTFSLHA